MFTYTARANSPTLSVFSMDGAVALSVDNFSAANPAQLHQMTVSVGGRDLDALIGVLTSLRESLSTQRHATIRQAVTEGADDVA